MSSACFQREGANRNPASPRRVNCGINPDAVWACPSRNVYLRPHAPRSTEVHRGPQPRLPAPPRLPSHTAPSSLKMEPFANPCALSPVCWFVLVLAPAPAHPRGVWHFVQPPAPPWGSFWAPNLKICHRPNEMSFNAVCLVPPPLIHHHNTPRPIFVAPFPLSPFSLDARPRLSTIIPSHVRCESCVRAPVRL